MNCDMKRDWLKQAAFYRAGKAAFIDTDRNVTFTFEQAHRVANYFALRLKLEHFETDSPKGRRVALLAQDPMQSILAFFACQRLGLILVPLNYRLSHHELSEIMVDADPSILLVDEACLNQAETIRKACPTVYLDDSWDPVRLVDSVLTVASEIQHHEVCMMLYTSGTTGVPKGVLITHEMLFWNSVNTSFRLNLTEDDSVVNFLPYFHTGAWNVLLLPLIHRCATTILMARFDAGRILEKTARYRCSLIFGVPTTLRMLAEHPNFESTDLSSLRFALTGGESAPIELIQRWQNRGIAIRQGYGLTEFGPNVFSLEESDAVRKIGSIGQGNYYCETAIMSDKGEILQGEAEGELVLKGPSACGGYWRKPDLTEALFFRGWLRTGDHVRRDADGYYYVIGRKKDMYISGGENVYPAEVEAAFSSHPDVREVAVIGFPDPKWGERGIAFISLSPGTDVAKETLLHHVSERIARYKLPAEIILIETLPRNGTGKIAKLELKRLAHERYKTHHT